MKTRKTSEHEKEKRLRERLREHGWRKQRQMVECERCIKYKKIQFERCFFFSQQNIFDGKCKYLQGLGHY